MIRVTNKKLILQIGAIILAAFMLFIFSAKSFAADKYVYYDMDTWKRYISTTVPNCSHKKGVCCKYVEDNYHAEYCPSCGVIFRYSKCNINNKKYSSPSDYYHDRCLKCMHKIDYVYEEKVVDKSNRTYID